VLNDSELLHHYTADHSEDAFNALVQRYLNLVYFAALRRTNGDAPLAQDVTQQVFAALAGHAAALQHHTVLTGWLYVTTRHAAANAMRAEQRRLHREKEAHAMQETSTSPEQSPDWDQLRPQLDHALDALNEHDRMAVLLRFFENRPFAEIGATLRVSEDAARVRVARALDKLRAVLMRRGITSTAAALAVVLASQSVIAAPPGLAASVTGFVLTNPLAASAGSTAAAFNPWHFMSSTKILIAAASITIGLALGTAFYESHEAHRAQTALAAAGQENAGLRDHLQRAGAQIEEMENRLRAAETLAASRQKSADEAARKSAAQAAQVAAARQAIPTDKTTTDILMASPEYLALYSQYFRNSLRFSFGPLYRRLGFSPEQISEFEAAIVEQREAGWDALAAARSQGLAYNDPLLGKLMTPVQKDAEEKLKAVLGAAGENEYKAYIKTVNARSSVDALAVALYYTEAPLTAGQADQMVQLVAANIGKGSVAATGATNYAPIDWDKVTMQARTFLTTTQFEALQAVADKQRLGTKLSELSQQLTNSALATAPNPNN
jgi:RNA polymerase sigma factor (sigma-70 family)